MNLDQCFDIEFFRKLVRMNKLYKDKKIPLAKQKELMSIFFYLIDHSDFEGYVCHTQVRLLFENLFNQLAPTFTKGAVEIYKKMYPLRRKFSLREDNPYYKHFCDLLEKIFPECCSSRIAEVKYIHETLLTSNLNLWLEDKKEKIKEFSLSFPTLYDFFISPLYEENCREKPFYIFFLDYHFNRLFNAIDGHNLNFCNDIELTLNRLLKSYTSNGLHLKKKCKGMFSSCKFFYQFTSQSFGVFGEIFTAKSLFDSYGANIKLEILDGKGCDFRFLFKDTYYLIESKAKGPGHGFEGNKAIINNFFKNYVFYLTFDRLLHYIMPEFCEEHKAEMAHFSGCMGTGYDQCPEFIDRICLHFEMEKLSPHKITIEQEQKILLYTILELYDQPIFSRIANRLPGNEEKKEQNKRLAKNITNKPFWLDLLQSKPKQLFVTQGNHNQQKTKRILHVYLPDYKLVYWDPFTTEEAMTAGIEELLQISRQTLNRSEFGVDTELWISDGGSPEII